MASTDAHPVPKLNTAFRLYFSIRTAAGVLVTSWAGADSEVSKDGAAFTDCSAEATEIGTSGFGYIDLTAGEMNTNCTVLQVKVTNTGAVVPEFYFYPQTTGDISVDLQSILNTLLTETSGLLAGGFKKFFNVSTPTGTLNSLPGAAAEAAGGLYTRGTGAGQINQAANGTVDTNPVRWNGTAVATPATAGIPEINVKNINNVAATSVTAVNANLGTTQPVNFTGTGASALAKADMVDVAGSSVSTSSAQIGANAVNWAGGAIPAPAVTGVPKIDLSYILGTLLTETAGLIAAGFKKFFNIASPTSTMNEITLVDTVTTTTTATNLTNAPSAGDFTSTMKTSLNAATPASVTGAVGSVTGNVGGNVTGSVGSVLGNVGGNVVGSVANVLDIAAAALAKFFTTNSGSTYGASVAGSVVKEIADNATTSPTTIATAVQTGMTSQGYTTARAGYLDTLNGLIAAIFAYAASAVTTAGSAFKYILDTLASIVSRTDLIGQIEITLAAPVVGFQIVPLVTNRSYKNSLGNPVTFTVTGLAFALTDPGIDIRMNVAVNGGTPQAFTGTATSATAGYVDVDPTETVDWLPAGSARQYFASELLVDDGTDAVSIVKWQLPVEPGVGT